MTETDSQPRKTLYRVRVEYGTDAYRQSRTEKVRAYTPEEAEALVLSYSWHRVTQNPTILSIQAARTNR